MAEVSSADTSKFQGRTGAAQRLNFTAQDSVFKLGGMVDSATAKPHNYGQEIISDSTLNNRATAIDPFRYTSEQPPGGVFRNIGPSPSLEEHKVPESIINLHQHFNQPNIVNFNNGKQHQQKKSAERGQHISQKRGSSAFSRNQQFQNNAIKRSQEVKRIKSAYPTKKSYIFQSNPSLNLKKSSQRRGEQTEHLVPDQMSNQDYLIIDSQPEDLNISSQTSQAGNFPTRPVSSQFNFSKKSCSPNKRNQLIYTSSQGLDWHMSHKRQSRKALVLNSYKNLPQVSSSLKRLKENHFYKKEDIYDTMISLKLELNALNDENMRQKTKLASLQEQLKYKDKFIGDLLQSTYQLSLAVENRSPIITTTENYPQLFQNAGQERKDNKLLKHLFQNFIDRGPESIIKIKQHNLELQTALELAQQQLVHQEQPSSSAQNYLQIQQSLEQLQEHKEIAELAISSLIKNGLVNEVNSQRKLKLFASTMNMANLLEQDIGAKGMFQPQMPSDYTDLQLQKQELKERVIQLEQKLKSNQSTLANTLKAKQNFEDENKNLVIFIQSLESRNEQNEQKINELNLESEKQKRLLSARNLLPSQDKNNKNQELENVKLQLTQEISTSSEAIFNLKKQLEQAQSENQKVMNLNQQQTDKFLKISGQLDEAHTLLIKKNQDYIQLQQDFQKLQTDNQQKIYECQSLNQRIKRLQSQYDLSLSSKKNLADNFTQNVQKLNRQITLSQQSNQQLKEEINYIQERLKNVNIEDVDERSDLVSHLSNILERENSVKSSQLKSPGLRKQATVISRRRKNQVQEIIQEEPNDDLENTVANIDPKVEMQNKIKNSQIKERRQSKQFQGIMRSQTYHDIDDKKQNQQKNSPDLLNRLREFQDDEDGSTNTIVTEIFSNYPRGSVKQNLDQTMVVRRDDPVIQKALSRLSRLQQIQRENLDQIEFLLFGSEYKAHKQIVVSKLSSILGSKLQLTEFQAQKFARFLVEEQNEQSQSEMVEFDPNKKVNLGLVVIKLMTASTCPTIYQQPTEIEVKLEFQKAMKPQQDEFINQIEKSKIDNVVSFILFQNIVWQILGKEQLKQEQIDCAFLSLCRIIPNVESTKTKDEIMIKQCFEGFHADNVHVYLKREPAKPSSQTEIRVESLSKKSQEDSEELNQATLPLKVAIKNEDEEHIQIPKSAQQQKAQQVKFQRSTSYRDEDSSPKDSPNAPVTPILGGFESKFPGSQNDSARLAAPSMSKAITSPLHGGEKQEFSFNENKDSSAETIFKTDSSFREHVNKTEFNNLNKTSETAKQEKQEDLADNYSASRSETDFDMQQSLVRGDEQLMEFKRLKSQQLRKEGAGGVQGRYTGKEIEIIRAAQNEYSASQNTDLNTPVIVSESEPSHYQTNESPNSMMQFKKKLTYMSSQKSAGNDKLKSAQNEQEGSALNDFGMLQEPTLNKLTSAERKIIFRNQQMVSFGGEGKSLKEKQTEIELIKKITMNKSQQQLEKVRTRLISIVQTRENKSTLLFAFDNVSKSLILIGNKLKQQKVTLREFFKSEIFVLKEAGLKEQEVIQPQEMLQKLEKLFSEEEQEKEQSLSFMDKTNLIALFDNPNVSGMILYRELCDAFNVIEVYDGRPQNTDTLSIDKLDHKAMRIVNRFVNYLNAQNKKVGDILQDKVSCQDFFDKLKQLNIRKCSNIHEPILKCLQVDESKEIPVGSIEELTSLFQSNPYFKLIGINKNSEFINVNSEQNNGNDKPLSEFQSEQ